MPQTNQQKRKAPSQSTLIRAVASSTAVETGLNVQALEQKLQLKSPRFAHIKLAR
ncbi:hypothetical protein [Niveibacterium terrae]|uniref:hypothetical protein n=1 Tax=Niveibacterium terrae TaxID=3373598 RepID=UPI003A908434